MMLDHSNLEEFDDPANYDREYGEFGRDGAFYLSLARQVGGPILEIACGTGRVTIPLAQAGYAMTGLDIASGMLDEARRKAGTLPIQWVQGDARDFRLNKQYRLIYITGNAFQAFLTNQDQAAMLACVRRHLQPDGWFAFDTRSHASPDFTLPPNVVEEWTRYTDAQGRMVRMSGEHWYDPIAQVQHFTVYRHWQDAHGESGRTARIALRYVYPQEMVALLENAGLSIVHCYGDWDLSPLTATSPKMIYVTVLR